MWFGKIIGGFLGFFLLGPLGALVGIGIGHLYDNKTQLLAGLGATSSGVVRQVFFETLFQLLGHIAKADGRISEQEIAQTEALIRSTGMTSDHRQQAIALFKQGAQPGFDRRRQIQHFLDTCGPRSLLKQTLLVYLISVALSDGDLDQIEITILQEIAAQLGFSQQALKQLIQMVGAQMHFRNYQGGTGGRQGYSQGGYSQGKPPPRQDELALAYQALGVSPSISDTDLKKTYRKLMSENHPDKLMGQGVPDDMVQMATQRAQEIQAAYSLIEKARKGS